MVPQLALPAGILRHPPGDFLCVQQRAVEGVGGEALQRALQLARALGVPLLERRRPGEVKRVVLPVLQAIGGEREGPGGSVLAHTDAKGDAQRVPRREYLLGPQQLVVLVLQAASAGQQQGQQQRQRHPSCVGTEPSKLLGSRAGDGSAAYSGGEPGSGGGAASRAA